MVKFSLLELTDWDGNRSGYNRFHTHELIVSHSGVTVRVPNDGVSVALAGEGHFGALALVGDDDGTSHALVQVINGGGDGNVIAAHIEIS